MRIFNWYIAKALLGTLFLALGILTFVMMSVHLFRIFAMVSNGVAPSLLAKMVFCLLPEVLRYALPFSILISTVLVFSRMSADNEIVALKASGVGIWQIVAPSLVLAIILCTFGVFLGLEWGPRLRYVSQQLRWQAMTTSPIALIEPDSITKLSDDTSIRVGSRDDKSGVFHDIHLYQIDKSGGTLRDLMADSCMIDIRPEERAVLLTLYHFTISERPISESSVEKYQGTTNQTPHFLTGDSLVIPLEYGTFQDSKGMTRKLKMMPSKMLMGNMLWNELHGKSVASHWFEFHQRLALAFSPLAFILLGIPFGIRNKRSETTSSLVICLVMALTYYAIMLVCDALVDRPNFHPEILIWIPNLAFQIGGIVALTKLAKH